MSSSDDTLIPEINVDDEVINETSKLTEREQNRLDEMRQIASDNSIPTGSEHIKLLRLINAQAKYEEDSCGSKEHPSVLNIEEVYDVFTCKECGNESKILMEDVPTILLVHKSFSNGIAHPLRSLVEKYGLLAKKVGKMLTLYGFVGSKRILPPSVPQHIRLHFENLIKEGNHYCPGCKKLLYGIASWDSKIGNWEVDHVHSHKIVLYKTDSFRDDADNYQALCRSCNARKRELDKKRTKKKDDKIVNLDDEKASE